MASWTEKVSHNALADPPVRICFTPFGTWSRRRAHLGRSAAATTAARGGAWLRGFAWSRLRGPTTR